MCFNPTASLIAFSIGFISLCVLVVLKIYSVSIIVLYLTIIQLLEYFAHKSIIHKDAILNIAISKLIFIFVFLQPIMFYVSSLFFKGKYLIKNANNYLCLIPIYIIFSVYFYYYLNKNHSFSTTYLRTCNKHSFSVCRLSWNFFSINKLLSLLFLAFYFFICLIWYKNHKFLWFPYIMLFLSVVYTFIFSNDVKSFFSIFGSIWCFLSITYGPLVILNHLKN